MCSGKIESSRSLKRIKLIVELNKFTITEALRIQKPRANLPITLSYGQFSS